MELDALRTLLDSLPSGGVAVVEGEPGIGKSALLSWAVEEATARGVASVQLQAERPTSARPFAMVHRASRSTGADITGMLSVERVVDQVLDSAPGESTLLTIDDVQWADAATLRSLAPIVRRAVSVGTAVIVATRTHPQSVELHAFLERVAPLIRAHLRLRPLSDVELVDMLSKVSEAPRARLRALVGGAGGNPMYAQLLAWKRSPETGLSATADNGAGAIDNRPAWSAVVDRALELGDDTFRALRAAAVLDKPFDAAALGQIAQLPATAALAALVAGHDAELLDGHPDGSRFRHDIIREALVHGMPAEELHQLHQRAIALLRSRDAPVADLATHLLGIEPPALDFDLVIACAQSATPPVALRLCDKLLECLGEDDARWMVAASQRVHALTFSGQVAEALAESADLLARDILDEDLAAAVRRTYIRSVHFLGRRVVAADAEAVLSPLSNPLHAALELADWATAAGTSGSFVSARALGLRALSLSDDDGVVAIAGSTLAWMDIRLGPLSASFDRIAQAIDAGERSDVPGGRLNPYHTNAAVRHAAGDAAGALEEVRRAHAAVDDDYSLLIKPFLHLVAATTLFDIGHWSDAQAELEAGLLASDDIGQGGPRRAPLDGLLALIDYLGDERTAPATLPRIPTRGFVDDRTAFLHAMVTEHRGDVDGARAILRRALEPVESAADRVAIITAGPDFVRLSSVLGATDGVEDLIGGLHTIDTHRDPIGDLTKQSLMAGLDGDAERLADLAGQLAELRPLAAARQFHFSALLCADGGHRQRARDLALAAQALYVKVGATTLEIVLHKDLRGRRIRLPRTGQTAVKRGWESVTSTEHQILNGVQRGLTNQAIADGLIMSRRTVESHLVRIYAKLGISSRVELVRTLLAAPPADR